jgi:DNA-binding IclR family transcriptional regulator
VAAPVHDGERRVLAALAVTGPTSRFGGAEVARMTEAVTGAALRISRIGFGAKAE